MERNSGKLRAKDLRHKHQCQQGECWHTAHAVPYGAPLALLITGYCPHCGATYLSLREASEEGVSGAAQQLVEHFSQALVRNAQPGMQTKH